MDTLPALLLHDTVLGVTTCTSLVSIQFPDHLLQILWIRLLECASTVTDSETLSMQMRRWQENHHPRWTCWAQWTGFPPQKQ